MASRPLCQVLYVSCIIVLLLVFVFIITFCTWFVCYLAIKIISLSLSLSLSILFKRTQPNFTIWYYSISVFDLYSTFHIHVSGGYLLHMASSPTELSKVAHSWLLCSYCLISSVVSDMRCDLSSSTKCVIISGCWFHSRIEYATKPHLERSPSVVKHLTGPQHGSWGFWRMVKSYFCWWICHQYKIKWYSR